MRRSALTKEQDRRDVTGGVTQKRRSGGRAENSSRSRLPRQQMMQEGNPIQRSSINSTSNIPASSTRSFLSAAELNDDILGCNEMPMSAAANNGELCNCALLLNLTSFISKLVSSLAQFKNTNSNVIQDVSGGTGTG